MDKENMENQFHKNYVKDFLKRYQYQKVNKR